MPFSNVARAGRGSAAAASTLERYAAWAMLANGALGLLVAVGVAVLQGSPADLLELPPMTSLLGVAAGLLAVRGNMAGLLGGLLFYGLQILSYYSGQFQFNFRSGFSLGTVVELPHGILVVNMAALAGFAMTLWLLAQRFRGRMVKSF